MTIGGENQHRAAKDLAWQQATLERLYAQLATPLLRFFLRRGCNLEAARDLKQEVFLQAVSGLGRFRGDASLETWTFGIAKNVWRKQLRAQGRLKREGREVPLEGSSPEDAGPALQLAAQDESPLEVAARSEELALVRRNLQEMPPVARNCTVLRMDRGMKYEDIGKLLQIQPGTAKSHVFRAKKRLKELFSNRQSSLIPPEESS